MAAIFRRISSCMRTTLSGTETSASGMVSQKVWTSAGRKNPGSTWVKARNVRIMRPDEISRTSASATWTITSAFRARCRSRLSLSVRPPSRRPVPRCTPACFKTGTEPNKRLAMSATPRVKSNTGASMSISPRRGRPAGAAREAEKEALQQQLRGNPAPGGAHCSANGQFLLASFGSN